MSVQALTHVIQAVRGLRPPERIVLLVMANYADEGGSCFPSVQHLSELCELNKETIRRTVRKLEAKGIVETELRRRTDGTRASNRYWLVGMGAEGNHPPRDEGWSPEGQPPPAARGGTPSPDGGGTPPPHGGALTLKIDTKTKKGGGAVVPGMPQVPEALRTEKFLRKWEGWLDYRRRVKRRPVSAVAAGLQLKELAEAGPEAACDAIDKSIQNDYQGLFPDKGRPAKDVDPAMHNFGWKQAGQ